MPRPRRLTQTLAGQSALADPRLTLDYEGVEFFIAEDSQERTDTLSSPDKRPRIRYAVVIHRAPEVLKVELLAR